MKNRTRFRGSLLAMGLCVALLALSDTALADPVVAPPVSAVGTFQDFTLTVPREKTDAYITMIEFYPPPHFEIQSFTDAEGWLRDFNVLSRETKVQKTVWTRVEPVPAGDFYAPKDQPTAAELAAQRAKDARFSFGAVPTGSGPYPMEVRETYSDGSVIHWTGSPSVAFPDSPAAASVRPPIMLDYPSSGNSWIAWVIGIAAAVILIGVVVATVIGLRRRSRAA